MIKDIIHRIIAITTLVTISPFLALVAVLIKIDSKGPVFYMQTRVGKHYKEFQIFKFRSMRSDISGGPLTSGDADVRITRVGKYIRKLHLDELAQLINVAKGDMLLVGPRPEVPEYTQYFKDKWEIILSSKPGITGLAAIELADYEYTSLSNSDNPSKTYIEEVLPNKLDLDIWYIQNQSPILDIKIIGRTIARVLAHLYA